MSRDVFELKVRAVDVDGKTEICVSARGDATEETIMMMLMEIIPDLLKGNKKKLGVLGMFLMSGKRLGELGLADVTKIDLSKIAEGRGK